MMKMQQKQRLGFAVLVLMFIVAHGVDAGLSCARIEGLLIPCLSYLRKGGRVPRSCCYGVRSVFAATRRSTTDRRGACKCLKAGYASNIGIKAPYARTLPGRCRLRIPNYLLTPTIDCNRVR